MQLLKRLFPALILSLTLAACGGGGGTETGGPEPDPLDPIVSESTRVITIGDSIGNGFGIATPWPTRLGPIISREVVNNSVTNEQTSFGVSVIQQMIDENDPTHVFILLGTNDAARGSVGTAINNLQQMVNIARANDVIPVVGTLPTLTEAPPSMLPDFDTLAANVLAEQISAGIRSLDNARIAPVRSMVSPSNIVDGIHPNDAGQQQIAEAMATQF